MCGIVGYVGGRDATSVLLGGLKRLEYRGYDSAGVAVVDAEGDLATRKHAGKLRILEDDLAERPMPAAGTGIGHTRWATHGAPNDVNAHPHLADGGRLAVIHNGIIENYALLRDELLAEGFEFVSETDTEIAAVLLGREYGATGSLTEAFQRTVGRLEGAFTILAVHADEPDLVVGARRNSPLVVGLGDGEQFLGSDVAAFVQYTRRAMAIGQDQIVEIRAGEVRVTDFAGSPVEGEEYDIAWDASAADKGGWSSFMAKEISEEPESVEQTLIGRLDGDAVVLDELGDALGPDVLRGVTRVLMLAAGTAAYAGLLGKYAIEKWAGVAAEVELAHEFRYRDPVLDAGTLVVSISQSGETMDTLMAVKYARERGARTLSICNTQGATIPRESDAVLYTRAGPEVAVASTKAFTAQVVALYLFALHLARVRGEEAGSDPRPVAELRELPGKLRQVLATAPEVRDLARSMSDTRSVLFLGRHVGYPIALEGALKLKELAYIHAEGFAAGELKHGPIALIEPGQRVFVVVPSPRGAASLNPKVVSNIQEIRARGAHVLAIVESGDVAVLPFADDVLRIPLAGVLFEPLLAVVPLQLFAMELAAAKGLDVDQPRNLAKSVTVE